VAGSFVGCQGHTSQVYSVSGRQIVREILLLRALALEVALKGIIGYLHDALHWQGRESNSDI
jgi:hypothetical protein